MRWMPSTTSIGVAGVGEGVAVDAGEGRRGRGAARRCGGGGPRACAGPRCPSCRSPAARSARCAPPARRPRARGAASIVVLGVVDERLDLGRQLRRPGAGAVEPAGHARAAPRPARRSARRWRGAGPDRGRRAAAAATLAARSAGMPSATSRSIDVGQRHRTEVDAHRAAGDRDQLRRHVLGEDHEERRRRRLLDVLEEDGAELVDAGGSPRGRAPCGRPRPASGAACLTIALAVAASMRPWAVVASTMWRSGWVSASASRTWRSASSPVGVRREQQRGERPGGRPLARPRRPDEQVRVHRVRRPRAVSCATAWGCPTTSAHTSTQSRPTRQPRRDGAAGAAARCDGERTRVGEAGC